MRAHPFRLYGHRGAAAHHPENTLRSFRAAIEAGVDAIETDVRISADGQVVVFHDADGQRTCGRPDLVRTRPWSEVAGWDAGHGERPILLAALLEEWPSMFVNVDVKDPDADAALRTLDVVRRVGAEARVGLGSFHAVVARTLRKAGWTGQLALAPPEVVALRLLPGVVARRLVKGDAAQIPTRHSGFRLDPAWFVERCHAFGVRVDYWTIDDPAEAVGLVRLGADGIVTNDPAAVGAAIRAAR